MNLSNENSYGHELELQPCPDCPYPMNTLVNRLGPKNNCERFSVTCRECGDSWTELIEIGDNNEND
jgi:RNase P subunit RPR2